MTVTRLRSLSLLLAGCAIAVCAAADSRHPKPQAPALQHSNTPTLQVTALTVEPADLTLTGPRAEGRVVVTARLADGTLRDVTPDAILASADVKVVAADREHVLKPKGDGAAVVLARYGGKAAGVKVKVVDALKPTPIDFTREIVPILSHSGCNAGACHGSQYGKGGFKLSLLGLDPQADYAAIARYGGGRRVQLADPASSLLLRKPTLAVAHQGGKKIEPGSYDYKLLMAWMLEGAPGPVLPTPAAGGKPATPGDAEVTKVDVFPAERVLRTGQRQTLVVRATYSDGVASDVTRWARLQVLNDAVAGVSPEGIVKAGGRGETAVMVRYCGQATVARVSVPFAQIAHYPQQPKGNYVDDLVQRKWRALGLIPSAQADDAAFIRRTFFDLIGTPPTPDEVRAFLADRAPDKRAKMIDRVLDRPEYADYWGLKWGDLLRSERMKLGPKGMFSFSNWIRGQFRDNRPMDGFVRDLITAQGSTYTYGPANFYRVAGSPPDRAETTAQVFLGTRLQCAKCHHHPFERWSQADYYQFAAFFARVGVKGSQEFGIFGNEQVVRLNNGGEVYHPKANKPMKPTPLGGYPEAMRVHAPKTAELVDPDPDAAGDRRTYLADWITRDNILFARNIVNRYWGYLMGRGLVEPIDDQRVTNPPTNPELLDALAKDFIAHKYDVKHLLRTICNSRAYQLSSDPTKQNAPDGVFYSHMLIKRLPAEVMLDAINFATGTKEKFNSLPIGFRAIQLPDPAVESYFLDTFGRAPRVIACECERSAEPNMGQALHLMMGDLVNRKVQDGQGTLAKLIADKKSDVEIVEQLYLLTLGRPPRAEEQSKVQEQLREVVERQVTLPKERTPYVPFQLTVGRTPEAKAKDRKAVLEDILWALLNSKEFTLNH